MCLNHDLAYGVPCIRLGSESYATDGTGFFMKNNMIQKFSSSISKNGYSKSDISGPEL